MTVMTLRTQPASSDGYEAAVDEAIATCNGSLRGALKALIIANEFLERDLKQAVESPGISPCGRISLPQVAGTTIQADEIDDFSAQCSPAVAG